MRKGALNDAIKEAGCNKVAYAHHRDDAVETMMLSLLYEGRLHTFFTGNLSGPYGSDGDPSPDLYERGGCDRLLPAKTSFPS